MVIANHLKRNTKLDRQGKIEKLKAHNAYLL